MSPLIAPDLWEKKKDVISKLYREEDWPLKQVLKRVWSKDFKPSENQLRSRLKRWQITKRSRRTFNNAQFSNAELDMDREVTRKPCTQSPLPRDAPRSCPRHESPAVHSLDAFMSEEHSHSELESLAEQLTLPPSREDALFPNHAAIETFPANEALMANTTSSVALCYHAVSAYQLSTEPYLLSYDGKANVAPDSITWPLCDVSTNHSLNSAQCYQMDFKEVTLVDRAAQSNSPISPSLNGYIPSASDCVYYPR
ncbi:hypothetical protein PENANT_c132G00366 [Penicillium antarcticum]|uniref:Clr5 domain-containing protein n=1 Tax=Penicillium antarcticum TaxID=416450 RepID=A0A1V6PGX1_9EURO|nr:hypothetical protein PENANT_c132G00366 [Penicillium antarcticum]